MFPTAAGSSKDGFSLVEVMVTVGISAIVMFGAANFYQNFVKSQRRMEAASNAEKEIDAFEKIFRKRWAQRERPLNPATEIAGEFTRQHPGFLFRTNAIAAYNCNRNTLYFQPACYSWDVLAGFATNNNPGCVGNQNCSRISLLISSINNANVRSADWLAIENQCQTYPALARFNYSTNAANSCRCARSAATQRQVNQVVFNDVGGVVRFPPDPSAQLQTALHSLAVCFNWTRPAPATPPLPLNDLNVDIEGAYLGSNDQITFLRKRISLPVNAVYESSESLQR
jgi:prepilin-type N-terminal cleavage/methylation domain-containing protein